MTPRSSHRDPSAFLRQGAIRHTMPSSRRKPPSSAVQNPLETYLRDINEVSLLSADDEKRLAEAIARLQQQGRFQGATLGQARSQLMQELLGGSYDTPLGPIRFRPDGEVVQGRFYVAEVRMQPDGRRGRFTLVRDLSLDSQPAEQPADREAP
jgi:ABC-type branched-subunit amino acid transport system substrate-binding protein